MNIGLGMPMIRKMIPEPTIIRSRRRRRWVALHVEPNGGLRVLAPPHTSLRWIYDFIEEKKNWIEKRRIALQTEKKPKPFDLSNGSRLPFMGEMITLRLELAAPGAGTETTFLPEQKTLAVSLPPDLKDAGLINAETRTELVLWYKKQARHHLQTRARHWETESGLRPAKLLFSNARQQWGSCSADNIIRLNWRLITAAPALIDYIIVHELCHIPHKNHGKAFWSLCGRLIPDMRKRRQELRKWEEICHPARFL